jgi:type I restriction enzyme S subunit
LFEGFLQPLNKLQTGTSYPAVRDDDVFSQIIPLPPLPEQRAIVAKIELLFSDLDNGIANLKKAQEQLKIYRQAVLKKAFVGELTRKWREEQTDLASAEELLLQIKEEREKHYQKQLDEWKQAVKEWEDKGKAGKNPSRPKKPKELPPLSERELKDLPELPEGWCYNKLGFVTRKAVKVKNSEQDKNSDFIYLDIGGIDKQTNKIISHKRYKWRDAPSRAQQIVHVGNTLFSTVRTYLKNIAIVEKEEYDQQICSSGFTVIRGFKKIIKSKFIFYLCIYEGFIQPLNKLQTGTSYPAVRDDDVFNQPVPICSKAEQYEIVREIETRLSVCDKLEATIAESMQKSGALRQSILKKAFVGELLSEKELEEARNAPDWEPADKLLERIKAEKEKPGNKKSF